ncbi:TraB/GumN family protein [Lewinella sp. W8]|uniref:TraB/GumN family protein n=1 Tax=Lewinella sp. W8 TaxID=2528208 RepID=UPI001068C41D|nr:TraB/GumN family protein [Lewinella sp. W8]MTB51286.1 TraB/GumN family protein [Lewinella sp. W8]
MRTLILCFLTTLFFFGALQPEVMAQRADLAPAASPLAPTATDTTLLWRISAPGIDAPSYLYGTIHLIPEEDYFLPNTVVAALNDSKEVVFEIDPRDMQNPAKIMGLLNKINMRGDTSLEDLLPKAQYDSVEAYFSESGLPFFFFKKMKPLFLSAMVGQDMQAMGQGGGMAAGGMKSYEMELTDIAQAADKRISGLETMEFQLSLFDSIPYTAQALMLFEAVKADMAGEEREGPNQLDQMVDMYKRRAVAEMASSISDEAAGVARFEELLLTKRNQNWIPLIRQAMEAEEGGSRLFAVGAGHLGGERGVIALLRSAGLTVEPVY